MEQKQNKMVRIFKRVAGGLGIEFENYATGGGKHILSIPSDQEFKPLPVDYVVSMFYLPKTLKSYNQGKWTMNDEDKEIVVSRAKELGLYFGSEYGSDDMDQPEVLYSEREIVSFLERRRHKEVKNIIENGNRDQKLILANAASNLVMKLDGETINLIEEGLKIAIVERD